MRSQTNHKAKNFNKADDFSAATKQRIHHRQKMIGNAFDILGN